MVDEISNTNNVSSVNDNVPIVVQNSVVLTSHMEGSMLEENATVNDSPVGNSGHNSCPQIAPTQTQSPVTTGWPLFSLPSSYTLLMGGYRPPIRFGNASEAVGSTSNGIGSIAAFQQHVDESHHDLVNLLTQRMTTILNSMMVDHETKFEHLARQVEWIARIVDYDKGDRQNVDVSEDLENMPRNRDGDIRLGGDIPRVV
ncbi:hypothetical protein Ahy_B06g083751 [Arachis hypogaea]|uniref:Uncharacterized protein n=1 Tax=Arachis hypogaea TaxID=3818 RepID=A0A444YQI5_ARAHY|nr:hypothetical protein Ahy_B06g083751 [Arachis hypogaea]